VAGNLRLQTRLGGGLQPTTSAADNDGFLGDPNNIKTVGTTVPGNGDLNLYGVAVVRESTGALEAGEYSGQQFQ
jgi:hypothetical protein